MSDDFLFKAESYSGVALGPRASVAAPGGLHTHSIVTGQRNVGPRVSTGLRPGGAVGPRHSVAVGPRHSVGVGPRHSVGVGPRHGVGPRNPGHIFCIVLCM